MRPPLSAATAFVLVCAALTGSAAASTTARGTATGMLEALHSRMRASPKTCARSFEQNHDRRTLLLSSFVILGLVVSYLPQHYRIIKNRTGQGFSPFFLLLGATSSACSLFNIVSLQWGQVECCRYLSGSACIEGLLGIAQILLQWLCFNIIFVLFLAYYPLHERYVRSVPMLDHAAGARSYRVLPRVPEFFRTSTPAREMRPEPGTTTTTTTATGGGRLASADLDSDSDSSGDERFDPSNIMMPGTFARTSKVSYSPAYAHALMLFALVVVHFVLSFLTTSVLLATLPEPLRDGSPPALPGHDSSVEHASERALRVWATVLGLASALLACVQYLPQLVHTARAKTVGSLSVPMMCVQTPGSFVFVYTLAVRPGVNWTAWGTYFVTGVLQGTLLAMCLAWKVRQSRLKIDDWGRPLTGAGATRGEREPLLPSSDSSL